MDYFTTLKILPASIAIPSSIRLIAKSLQLFSSKLTVIFTDKLFTTPVNFSVPKREQVMWESAQKKRVKVESLGQEIDVLSYGYSTKKVLLVHGWCGRSTQLYTLADKLLENGCMVISFDGPAHGKSEGKRTSMIEFIETIKQLNKDFGPFVSAVGHSFGGMTLYNCANELDLKNFVTVGSGDKVSTIINDFIKNLQLKPIIASKLHRHFNKKWNINVDDYSSSEKAKDIKTPVLVVHDTLDGDVGVSCAVNIRQKLQNGTLLITHGLGHTKILRDKATMNKVVEFIKTNL
ncbi:alpha/beta fold hydrolase [Tenacibaculum sp. IB213877]|uniref:alpha/beta fold hydrolase n=1 Tax=Tenacibaculum sp. IB213877 TaxID=3097351 RepID=UPI002A5A1400|nr:alpha/beta fold hydrolase [Tenacibaculum sp. IB213877]MDY0779410.1 alpha/beta fold hydrolase [Tenacibaculum sp. IB213877]